MSLLIVKKIHLVKPIWVGSEAWENEYFALKLGLQQGSRIIDLKLPRLKAINTGASGTPICEIRRIGTLGLLTITVTHNRDRNLSNILSSRPN